MDIVQELRYDSKPKEWTDGLQWLGWNTILGLMPIWMTLLLLRCFQQPITLHAVTANGEFALYAASFLGTCFYIVARDFRERPYPSRGAILLILAALLVGSVFIYIVASLVTIFTNLSMMAPILRFFDRDFLLTLNLGILPLVCLMTYLLIVADNVRSTADLAAVSKRGYDEFAKKFDDLKE